ncbi:MAG: biotin--[acetyl-CoA-carboxylase] ligase [Gemmataceae bacterium]
MIAPETEWQLPTRHLGQRVLVFTSLDSTNNHAGSWAHDRRQHGLAILARRQTAGRGQQGRSWVSPPDSSVLLSLLLFPPPILRRPAILTAWAAVSVCATIRQTTGLDAHIKWPNDVLIQGRKVCGILIEQQVVGGQPFGKQAAGELPTIVGIGLNVHQSQADFLQAGLLQAGSLSLFTTSPLICQDVARRLLHQLDEEYDRVLQGDWVTLETQWQARVGLIGKKVLVEQVNGTIVPGRLRNMTFQSVQLETPDKSFQLSPEAVRHITLVEMNTSSDRL